MKRHHLSFFCLVLLALVAGSVTAAKTPIRMALAHTDTATTLKGHQRFIETFNRAHPDYDLQIEMHSGYYEKIPVMLAAGVYPDTFFTAAANFPGWIEQGLLLDLEPFWQQSAVAKRARLYPFIVDSNRYKGRMYGVPYDFSFIAWALNLDALAESGLPEPPPDWDVEMLKSYALKLNKPEQGRYGVQLGASPAKQNWQWTANYIGEGWVSEDLKRVNVENPGNIDMLEFWQDLVWGYDVSYVSGKPAAKSIENGGYGMWSAWGHYGIRYEEQLGYSWGLTTYPKGPVAQNCFAHCHAWAIPAIADRPEIGWVLLEWMLSSEGQRAVVEHLGRQPMSPDTSLWNAYYALLSPTNRNRILKSVTDNIMGKGLLGLVSYWPTWSEVERIMNTHLSAIFTRRESPANEMAAAATKIRPLINLK